MSYRPPICPSCKGPLMRYIEAVNAEVAGTFTVVLTVTIRDDCLSCGSSYYWEYRRAVVLAELAGVR